MSDKNKTLYVMVGLPGSGKSTYIKNMKSDAVVLSTDNYIEKKAQEDGLTYSDVFETYIKEAEVNLKRDLQDAIDHENDIIWDQTNLRIKKRAKILQLVPSSYKKVAVEFEVPLEVILKRLDKRAQETGKVISDNVVYLMHNTREPVIPEEPFDEHIKIEHSE